MEIKQGSSGRRGGGSRGATSRREIGAGGGFKKGGTRGAGNGPRGSTSNASRKGAGNSPRSGKVGGAGRWGNQPKRLTIKSSPMFLRGAKGGQR